MLSEATWTQPRPECPMPGYWHAPDPDSTEIEVTALVAAFVTALQPEYVVETGTAFGQTALAIGHALQANGHGRLDTIEPDPVRAAHCRDLLSALPVTLHEQTSLTFTPARRIDFAWFDSLIDLRVPEFHTYRQHMTAETIIGFHDCGPQHNLRPDVERLGTAGLIRPIYLPTPRGVVFAQVTPL